MAAVARRHGLNANLVFKWIRRSRDGWRDRRREPANKKPVVVAPPEGGAPAFVPVKLLALDAPSAPPPSDAAAKRVSSDSPRREARRDGDQPAELALKVLLDADVDAEALRRVLFALGIKHRFRCSSSHRAMKVYLACKPVDMRRWLRRVGRRCGKQTLRADPYSGAAFVFLAASAATT